MGILGAHGDSAVITWRGRLKDGRARFGPRRPPFVMAGRDLRNNTCCCGSPGYHACISGLVRDKRRPGEAYLMWRRMRGRRRYRPTSDPPSERLEGQIKPAELKDVLEDVLQEECASLSNYRSITPSKRDADCGGEPASGTSSATVSSLWRFFSIQTSEMRLVLWTVCLLLVSGWGALADEPDNPEDEFMFPSWDGDNRILNIGSKNFKKAVKDSEVLIVLFSADFDEHSEGDTQEEVSEYALQQGISIETADGKGSVQ
uniref:Uncharacterized protein n=1 Tax=Branchiostoma floridae TaxID=7739 RepID=C3YGK0_BRAFL|eukprot:XP_002604499.1 hypothetical protein BRAFLDRAFT_79343 [Branchiostoma floridae]